MFCAVSIVADIALIYLHYNKSEPIITTNISQLSADVKNYVFEIKYFENADDSGIEMYEIKLSAYTGINKNKVYGYGIQVLNPLNMTNTVEYSTPSLNIWTQNYDINGTHVINFNNAEVSYFNSDNNVSYDATTSLNVNNYPYVIDIDKETYAFDFNKRFCERTEYDWLGFANNYYFNSNFEYFVFKTYKSMSTLSQGEGVYENLNVNLNDVFNIYEFNTLTGKFDKLSTVSYSAEYIGVKITYVKRGARIHSDSMFNKIGSGSIGGVIYE